jgi:hypothetical protein
MIYFTLALTAAGFAVLAANLTAFLLGRTGWRTLHGGNAAANALVLLGNVIHGSTTLASISAAVMALSLWQWWNSGGGDDTKRRLRKWARKFQGVRRTAPAGGTA